MLCNFYCMETSPGAKLINMENQPGSVEALFQKAGDYVDTRIELFKLKTIDKSSEIVSSLFAGIVITILIIFFLLLLNVGVALWIGGMLGRFYYGFFIVAGFYLVAALVLYIFRNKWLKAPISDSIIKKVVK